MKKTLCILLLFMGFSSLNAQLLKFGIKAGANFSNLEGDDVDGSNYTSFHFGGTVEIKVLENFSVQPELLYSSQGTKVDQAAFDDINYSYITVPVLAKFYLTDNKLSLEAGPQFSFLVDDNVEEQFETESFDFGVAGGLGYNITEEIAVQARYVLGLNSTSRDADITNRVIQLSVGYRF